VVVLKAKRDVSCLKLICSCCFKSARVIPGIGELTGADKLYEVNERGGHVEDGSFSRLVVHPQPEGQVEPLMLQVEPRLIAQDFVDGEERPTTRARTVGEGSFLARELEAPFNQ